MTVGIKKEFRNYQCFLWARDGKLANLETYRMNRNCFGVKYAQFNVIAVIRMHASKYMNSNPLAAKAIAEDQYMDDLITGADSLKEAESRRNEIFQILKEAGMTMKKWRFSGREKSEESQQILALQTPEKVLGVVWDSQRDILTFNAKPLIDSLKTVKSTKRTVLGAAARLYDPTGFLSPYLTQIELIIQELHA